jgi:CubicO group peptidase (beta-lactamase class C family)
MHLRVLSVLAGAALCTAAALAATTHELPQAKPESVGMSSERLARLGSGMKDLVDQGRLSGVVTMVARHGKVIEFEATGKGDLEANAPMQKDSIFRIYSMSKPITGVAMMMLFEEGKWQLSDPVSKYVPEFANLKVYATESNGNMSLKEPAHPMTMRELMSHQAGLSYGFFSNTAVDKLQRDANLFDPKINLEEFVKRVAKLPLNSHPGSEWHYSIAVDIQGYVVQKLSGMPFDEFLEKRIFKPLGMVDTAFYVPKEKLARFVQMYAYGTDRKLVPVGINEGFNHDYGAKIALISGGGGLVSTATDYMRFCQMLLNGGQLEGVRLLSPRTVELMRSNMLEQTPPTFAPGTGFGLDFAVYTDPAQAGGYYGLGTYFWGGAAGTWFWIDPVNDLIEVGMIQQVAGTGATPAGEVPDMRGLSHALTYQAIVN